MATTVGLMLFLALHKSYNKYKIFTNMFVFDLRVLKEVINIGLPIGCMHLIEVSTFAVVTFWIGDFGTETLAAHQIVLQYLGMAITLVFAMSQAVTIRVGHAYGAKNYARARNASIAGMLLNAFALLVLIALYLAFPDFFLKLDMATDLPANQDFLAQTKVLLNIGLVLLIFDNFRIIGFGALRGIRETRFSMFAAFISFWTVGLPSAYLLAFTFGLKGPGIWIGLTLGIACGALIILLRLRYSIKKLSSRPTVAL
jgi:MATE family multidrug resistance protein